MDPKSVQTGEWVVAVSLSLFIMALLAIGNLHTSSQVKRLKASEHLFAKEKEFCQVIVTGLVAKPGTYSVEKGTPFSAILKKCRPKKWADLKNFSFEQEVVEDMTIEICPLQEIVVKVKGEVLEEMRVVLPIQSRICDLKSKVLCTTRADRSFFKKRRQLYDGEEVVIPSMAEQKDCN